MLRLILVILPAMAFAAAPRTQAANKGALSADEVQEPKEATVRASSEAPARAAVPEAHETPTARKQQNKVVSMAVDADGHISQGASKATPVTEATPVMANAATPVSIRANSEAKPTEVPVAEVETKKEVGEAQPHAAYSTTKVPYGQRVAVHMEKPAEEAPQTAYTTTKVPYGQRVSVHYQAPEDDQKQQEGSDNQASWKSVFFFFASIVLIVILAGGVATHLYMSKKAEGEHVGDSKLGLKAHEASSGATALQAHLNDSSSTSDSGEKIAMLFDRVRKSLEDLGDQAPNDAADIAGAGKGGTQTNAI